MFSRDGGSEKLSREVVWMMPSTLAEEKQYLTSACHIASIKTDPFFLFFMKRRRIPYLSTSVAVVPSEREAEICGAVHAHHHLGNWHKHRRGLTKSHPQFLAGLSEQRCNDSHMLQRKKLQLTELIQTDKPETNCRVSFPSPHYLWGLSSVIVN